MTTAEVTAQLTKNEPDDSGEGPVHADQQDPAQGLLEKHRRLSVKANEVTAPSPYDDASEEDPRKDRVMSTGATTPGSLVAEIEARVAASAHDKDKKAKTEGLDNKS